MRRTPWFIILSAAFFLPAMPLVAQAPSILEGAGSERPLWVSAEAAAHEEKIVDLDLIDSDDLQRTVEKQRQALGGRPAAEAAKTRAGQKPLVTTIPD
jgi:hypothetical protein